MGATESQRSRIARSLYITPVLAQKKRLFWIVVALAFMSASNGAFIYAIAGLLIFAGLIAFDFQRLGRSEDISTAPLLAAAIFLDVLNVFLLLLSVVGGSDE